MKPGPPDPVKLFIGALYSDIQLLEQALERCEAEFGPVAFRGEEFPFRVTDYYDDEMGQPIHRQFVSFRELIDPGDLPRCKLTTNDIEDELAVNGNRKVNLDTGYMDYHKVVLASAKYNGQKIYLDHGIYADPTLYYEKGTFRPAEWAFPDFKETDRYYDDLLAIRKKYKAQRSALTSK